MFFSGENQYSEKKGKLPKFLNSFNATAIKIPTASLTELEKTIFKFIWSQKDPQ